MRRKIKYIVIFLAIMGIGLCCYSISVGLTIIAIDIVAILSLMVLLLLNKLVKQTNWYSNIFIYTKQMCSNQGYRSYLIRNIEIANVGSNPARFAFHYDDVWGENWSTGNQGLDMDFEILKFRHSFIRRGGTVLLPLVAFSSISGYLRDKKEYLNYEYYAKFAHTLDPDQASLIQNLKKAFFWIKYPLLCNPKAIKYLIHDQKEDCRLSISTMPLMKPQLEEDARLFLEGWLKEFRLSSLDDPLSDDLLKGMDLSVKTMQQIIDYLEERELKPVLIFTPMSEPLQKYFTIEIMQKLVYDFVEKINRPNVLFLDYSQDKSMQNPQLYFNSLYLNLRGRKIFTRKVLKDLQILK